jgi:hypothetical protein
MHFCYDDTSVRSGGGVSNWADQDALRHWGTHFANSLQLKFFLKNGTTQEKLQAQHELAICERKQQYWRQHPRWDAQQAARIAAELQRQWQ